MPTGIDIGPLTIRFYGIIIMVGVLAAAFLTEREARRRGQPSELVWDGLIWIVIGGIVGARLWHILTPPPSMVERGFTALYYLTHPLDAVAIWKGGLGIPGAVIGGAIALIIYAKRRHLNTLMWLDIATPGVALGQAIGRWGNFFNQELYGLPTNLPWKLPIDPQNRIPGYENIQYYHPLFLYESLWNFGNVIFLLWIGRRYQERLYDGDVFLIYLITYPLGRFFLEFLRLDPAQVAGINVNQTIMVAIAIVSAGILIWRHTRKQDTFSTETQDPDSDE